MTLPPDPVETRGAHPNRQPSAGADRRRVKELEQTVEELTAAIVDNDTEKLAELRNELRNELQAADAAREHLP